MGKKVELIKKDKDKIIYLITDQNERTIEKILPLEAEPLYRSLADIQGAIPHIKQIYESRGKLIVDEEYIDALTLDEYIKRCPLTRKQIISIMDQLLVILDVLHHHDPIIVHRDIKPENIYYDGTTITLGDFDIARFYDVRHTADTTVLGSIGYAAPEQYGFSQTTVTSDLYSCGVLLNFLSTGYMPSVLLVKGMFRPIVKRATEIDPRDRYQSAQEMKRSLEFCTLVPVGFRKGKKSSKIIASISYVFMSLFILLIAVAVKKDTFWALLLMVSIYLWVYVFGFNYANAYEFCFFHKSRYKMIRLIGIILTAFSTYFFFFCFFGFGLYIFGS